MYRLTESLSKRVLSVKPSWKYSCSPCLAAPTACDRPLHEQRLRMKTTYWSIFFCMLGVYLFHYSVLPCRTYFAADAGEYELHITALFAQNSGLADPSAGVARSFIKTPLKGSPFNVLVTFADEAHATANKYQQPKRFCSLDDIASPSGGTRCP